MAAESTRATGSKSQTDGAPRNAKAKRAARFGVDPEYFINRELSILEFNARVLEEAEDAHNPLLERVKFLSIFSGNIDEFFMVRVAGLREQAFADGAPQDLNPDGLSALTQLEQLSARTRELVSRQYACFHESIVPALASSDIHIVRLDELQKKQRKRIDRFFRERAYPILTPMAIDPSHPRPRYHNRGLYLMAMLRRRHGIGPKALSAVVQLPQVLPRLVRVSGNAAEGEFVFVEELVAERLPELFGGFDVEAWAPFRVTRDSDLDVLDEESDDMLRLIEERLRARRRADAVRLEIDAEADDSIVERIARQEQLRTLRGAGSDGYSEVYRIPGPVDLRDLMYLTSLPNTNHLKNAPFTPQMPRGLRSQGEDIYASIARHDILLHHPYDSFASVIEFVSRAAVDPDVLAIKQTLYRTSGDSPIISALMRAADAGKHVTALVELKARFDEEANVSWARQLERSGVHVVFGFLDLKTHCKVSLVVRQEGAQLRRYAHLGTGNYNPTTAHLYTDFGLFTCDEDMVEDISALFNLLTGYSRGHEWRKLVVAPDMLQRRTIELIDQQAALAAEGRAARIFAKLNALVDPRVIEALFRASHAGVPIDLVVRGICCLRPGIEGVSENIRVRSIVDRFLEHSRLFIFGSDDDAQIYLASADWMPRNFHRRVEVMFPVESPRLKKRILMEILPCYLEDNTSARILQPDGRYIRLQPSDGAVAVRCQEDLLRMNQQYASVEA